MKRMIFLEIKKMIKNRLNIVLMITSITIIIIASFIFIRQEKIERFSDSGDIEILSGMDAINKNIKVKEKTPKEFSPEVIEEAILKYKDIVNKYEGNVENIPNNIYEEEITPISEILYMVRGIYDDGTDYNLHIEDIPIEIARNFYNVRNNIIEKSIINDYGRDSLAYKQVVYFNEIVDKPFIYEYGFNSVEFLPIIMLLLFIVNTVIIMPVFSSDYETGADDILRSTKNGRKKLVFSKIISSLIINIVLLIISMLIHIIIVNTAFGWHGMETSGQLVLGLKSFLPFNFKEILIISIVMGVLSTSAVTVLGLFISSKNRYTMTALLIGLILVVLPGILFQIPNQIIQWIKYLLPTNGSSFINELSVNYYLQLGEVEIWTPFIIIAVAIVSIIVFPILTIHSYNNHEQ